MHGGVIEFDPEDGAKVFAGSDLQEWGGEIFETFGVIGSEPLVKSFQEAHGPLAPDRRLVPIRAILDGGEYELDNLRAVASRRCVRVARRPSGAGGSEADAPT